MCCPGYYIVPSAEMEKVYDYVREQNRKSDMALLERESIELLEKLGAGNFGAVYRGRYKYQAKNKTRQQVDVAVKVLKCGDSPTAEVEFTASGDVNFNHSDFLTPVNYASSSGVYSCVCIRMYLCTSFIMNNDNSRVCCAPRGV